MVNSGKTKVEILQYCLRKIAFLAAVREIQVRLVHLDSKSNRISGHLSRLDLDPSHKMIFFFVWQQRIMT